VLGLVRNLVEWLPTSADWAAIVAGPLALVGYLVGSVTAAELSRRRTQPLAAEAIAGAITLLVTTIAWDVALQTAPRGAISATGTFSNQALGAWVSIALWTGAATLLGFVAPVWTGFRRGLTGAGPAVAMYVAYLPLLGAAGLLPGALVVAATGRWRWGLALGLAVVVCASYLAWIGDLQSSIGITHGPESSLWVAVTCGILFARSARMAE
jgi:hypothetical protein